MHMYRSVDEIYNDASKKPRQYSANFNAQTTDGYSPKAWKEEVGNIPDNLQGHVPHLFLIFRIQMPHALHESLDLALHTRYCRRIAIESMNKAC